MAAGVKTNPMGATVCGQYSFGTDAPKCTVHFEGFITLLKSALETDVPSFFYQRIYLAAQSLETSYNAGWRRDRTHVYGKHVKEISRFRHLLFDTARRGRAFVITKEELADLRSEFQLFLLNASRYSFRKHADEGESTREFGQNWGKSGRISKGFAKND